jgi:hypothetical protein
LDSRKLVIFNLAKGKLGSETSEAFGRFVLALMQSAILKRAQSAKAARVPVHLFIDEFQNYIAPSIAEILSESRKFGLHLTMAQQYLGQRMDTEFRRGILANTQIKMTGMSATTAVPRSPETGGRGDTAQWRRPVLREGGQPPGVSARVPTFLIGNRHAQLKTGTASRTSARRLLPGHRRDGSPARTSAAATQTRPSECDLSGRRRRPAAEAEITF